MVLKSISRYLAQYNLYLSIYCGQCMKFGLKYIIDTLELFRRRSFQPQGKLVGFGQATVEASMGSYSTFAGSHYLCNTQLLKVLWIVEASCLSKSSMTPAKSMLPLDISRRDEISQKLYKISQIAYFSGNT